MRQQDGPPAAPPHLSRQDKPSDGPAKSDAAGPQAAPNRRVAGIHNDGHLRARRDVRIGGLESFPTARRALTFSRRWHSVTGPDGLRLVSV
jgi:hypothetical protein